MEKESTTTRHPVDSTTRPCCGGIGRHANGCEHNTLTDRGPCPPWCSLPAGHRWDSIQYANGVESRGHGGLTFGPVYIDSTELSNAVGVHRPFASFDGQAMELHEWTGPELRRLSVACLAAAEYLDAHNGEQR